MAQTPGQQSKDNLFMRAWKWIIGTWQGRIVGVALVVALAISLYWWPESGFDAYQGGENFQRARTLWDWLGLLGVPVVLAVGGFAFSRAERKNEQEIAALRAKQDRVSANKRADLDRKQANERAALDRELAANRAKEEREQADDALRQSLVQDYMDRMSELLLDKGLASSKEDDLVREVARARTLTVLRGLGGDGARKGYIMQFLHETSLIKGEKPIIELEGASLQKADLNYVVLDGANLCRASLAGANLRKAYLRGADLRYAYLREACLAGAHLISSTLRGADLRGADLSSADLRGARLREANLCDAKVTNEQLALALSLEGAIMPNGSKYAGVPPTAGAIPAPSPDVAAQGSQDRPTT